MAAQADRGVPLSTLAPKFLHTNSTSHTWPFSAIAELIDNAYDPDVRAKQFWIDKTMVKEKVCLSFMDNGNGLDYETMHKMLSFGYSDKLAVNGQEPIGIYGNGFKSGSMRLGKDAIVFSKSKSTSCVGMLSQTYLEEIDAQQIIVPIVCFEERESKFSVREEHKASLQDILQYSPFNTQDELLAEIDIIASSWSKEKTGTRIIIWNLRRTSSDITEFDFETDKYDIRIPSEVYETVNDPSQHPDRVTSYIPPSVYSLRAYCSILYLKPRMQVMVRSLKVKTELIAKSLAYISKDHYKPTFLTKRIPITFGYNTKSKEQYGIMMYHKNRLIKAYERVGCQLKADNKGVGVIGVIECNFLDPTHNKQSFIETDKYRKTMNSLGIKLEEYWKEMRYRKNKENPNSTIPVEDTMKRPDQNWVQCDDCLRWRKLPDGIDCSKLPEKWFCRMNPDPQFRSCQVEEEAEDSDEDQPSYCKTYKKQEREEKKKQERIRQKAEEDRRRLEEQRQANAARQNAAPGRRQEDPQQRLHNRTVHTPSTPTTLRSRALQGGAVRAESSTLSSSIISQAACSPSSSNGLPIITSVCSLSPGNLRGKRTQPVTHLRSTPKRLKVNGVNGSTSDTPSSVDVTPLGSPSVPVETDDETDDDIVILETASTPKPKKPVLDISKVKKEEDESDNSVSMLECDNNAAMDTTSETNAAETGSAAVGASSSSVPPVAMSSVNTQTDVPSIKQETEDPNENMCNNSDKDQSSNLERVFKQESSIDTTRENHGKHTLQNGMTHHLKNDERAGPSCADAYKKSLPVNDLSVTEVQKQQDQLMELMQNTAQERDSLKEQVQRLTSELEAMQSRVQEMSGSNVKKECSHQASQTEVTEGEKDYKSLFEKAKEKINKLIMDKEASIAASETEPNCITAQGEENDIDEIALQVDSLIRQLDQSSKENNELRSRLDSLEEAKANLAAQCEELRLRLQQQREHVPTPPRNSDSSDQRHPEEAGGLADSGTHSSSDTLKSLLELRQNVGRLLITYVPALDLEQVNFNCNVIDEILEQYLTDRDSFTAVGLSDDA